MTQLTLTGEVLKQAGLDQVTLSHESFIDSMRNIARGISLLWGQVTSDDLREAASKAKLVPHNPNAWGAIFRGPEWLEIGRMKSKLPGNHLREIRVWKWSKA